MNGLKIVFTGTPGAGKTTAIGALSDRPPVVTDVRNSDASLGKERTTVGLDFGQFSLDDGQTVRLFGTPGQQRFDFMWKILATDALGLVILVDNSRPDPVADLRGYVRAFQDVLASVSCVVGVGRTEEHTQPTLDQFSDSLAEQGLLVPVVPVDVRRREDVLMLVDSILAQAEARA